MSQDTTPDTPARYYALTPEEQERFGFEGNAIPVERAIELGLWSD